MRKSRRDLWKDVERLEGDDADITVSSEVVTVTDPDSDFPVELPEGVTLLEAESPVVTAWIEPDD